VVAIEIEYGGEWGSVGWGVREKKPPPTMETTTKYAGSLRDTVRGGEQVGRTRQATWIFREEVYQAIAGRSPTLAG
jgi:hypothetical protein